MKKETAIEKAAQLWCKPSTQHKQMDVELAEAFADTLVSETEPLADELESAWGIIANAGGGDWTKETPEWQEAAAKWRDRYHALLMPNAKLRRDAPPSKP